MSANNIPPVPQWSGINASGGSSTWIGGTTYVQASDVLQYLQITNPTPADYALLNNIIIPYVCDYIDIIAGNQTWGKKLAINEQYSLGKPTYLGWYLVGTPIYLQRRPILPASGTSTLVHLGIWNGSAYQEWVGSMVEARWGSYWVDTLNGIVWIIGWYWYMGYEAQITYWYGYNVAGTNRMDRQVQLLALLKSAKMFLDNNRYTAEISQGIGGISMTDLWNYLNDYIPQLESAVRGIQTITGGWIA